MKKFREYYSINEQDIMGMINTAQSLMGGQSGTETDSVKVPEVDATQFQTTDKQKEVSDGGGIINFIFSDWKIPVALYLSYKGVKSKMKYTWKSYQLGRKELDLAKGGVEKTSPGYIKKIFSTLTNVFKSKAGTQGVIDFSKNINKSSFLKTFGGIITSTYKTIKTTPGLKNKVIAGGVGLTASVLGYFLWNSDMFEIAEQWKSKKHYKDKNDTNSKNIYGLITKGFFQSRDIGTGIVENLNSYLGFDSKEYCLLKIDDNTLSENLVAYDNGIDELDYCLNEGDFVKSILGTTNTENDWVEMIKTSYHDIPISGKSNLDDYGTIKNFISKWNLDGGSNYYDKELAEDSTGILDSNTNLFTPGMNVLGWATFFTSDDYLNNVNSLGYLKNRKFLTYVMRAYWITKVNNLDASNFSVNQFCKLVEILSDGNKNIYTNPSFVSNINYCKFGEMKSKSGMGVIHKIGRFQDLLTLIGKNITEKSKQIATTDETGAVTNVTISFALLWATMQLLFLLQNSTMVNLGQLVYLDLFDEEETEYSKFKGVKSNITKQQSKSGSSTQKSSGGQSQPKTDKIETPKTIEEVIDKVDNIPGIEEFEG
jgi:hypothetical protein